MTDKTQRFLEMVRIAFNDGIYSNTWLDPYDDEKWLIDAAMNGIMDEIGFCRDCLTLKSDCSCKPKDTMVDIIVQINGKLDRVLMVPRDSTQEYVEKLAIADSWKFLVKRTVFVPNRLINFVLI